jgi:hypothetical protein
MCTSDGMTDPPAEECAHPNRATITIDSFDPAADTIQLDLAQVVASSDLTANTADTAPGCQSFPNDVNECGEVFASFGLDFDTGACDNDCADQTVFSKAQ